MQCLVCKTYIYVFKHIDSVNPVDMFIAVFTLATIILFAKINQKVKAKIHFDIPINLVLVVLGVILSYELDLKTWCGIAIVGHVPTGFPFPEIPKLSVWRSIIGDSIVMALVSFSLNISMAILIARIHHQEINVNQELVAYGMCNLVSSPFHCHVSSASPVRCMLLHNDDAKSTLHSVTTVLLLTSIILGLGQLFKSLPIAVLAGVVLAATRGLLKQCFQLPTLWKTDKTDFAVWVSTFCVTVFIDMSYGLIFGIVVSFVGVVINNQKVEGSLMVKAVNENVFIFGDNRIGVQHVPHIRIFFFPCQLCYFNAEMFKRQLFKTVFDPTSVDSLSYEYEINDNEVELVMDIQPIRCIILNCSAMSHIDTDGINMLKMLVLMYHRVGVQILLFQCLSKVYDTLELASFFTILPKTCVFHELRDALHHERFTRVGVTELHLGLSTMVIPSSGALDELQEDDEESIEPSSKVNMLSIAENTYVLNKVKSTIKETSIC